MICSKCGKDVLGGDGHDGCKKNPHIGSTLQSFLEENSVRDLIGKTLAENYLGFGFADDGEADKVALRVIEVLGAAGYDVVKRN